MPEPALPAIVAPTFTVKAPAPDDALARLRDRAVFLDTRACVYSGRRRALARPGPTSLSASGPPAVVLGGASR